MEKEHTTIGCCGADCALCPRYRTEGVSKCPGCNGINFFEKHSPCSIINCCFKKKHLEHCGLCEDFPCETFAEKTRETDDLNDESIITHNKTIWNLKRMKKYGIEKYIEEQEKKINILNYLFAVGSNTPSFRTVRVGNANKKWQ